MCGELCLGVPSNKKKRCRDCLTRSFSPCPTIFICTLLHNLDERIQKNGSPQSTGTNHCRYSYFWCFLWDIPLFRLAPLTFQCFLILQRRPPLAWECSGIPKLEWAWRWCGDLSRSRYAFNEALCQRFFWIPGRFVDIPQQEKGKGTSAVDKGFPGKTDGSGLQLWRCMVWSSQNKSYPCGRTRFTNSLHIERRCDCVVFWRATLHFHRQGYAYVVSAFFEYVTLHIVSRAAHSLSSPLAKCVQTKWPPTGLCFFLVCLISFQSLWRRCTGSALLQRTSKCLNSSHVVSWYPMLQCNKVSAQWHPIIFVAKVYRLLYWSFDNNMIAFFWNPGEGWYFLDDVPPEQICHRTEKKYTPHVLHFCQRYSIGDFFISKYMYPDLIQCDTPLIRLPEQDSAVRYNYSHYGDGTTDNWPEKKSHLKYKNAFMVSTSSRNLCNLTR